MPRKSKEVVGKKEDAQDLSRRRSARLAAAETKPKPKETSPSKAPKRQAAKKASKEVAKAVAEDETVSSNVESNASIEKIEQDGDKNISSEEKEGASEPKKPRLDNKVEENEIAKPNDDGNEESAALVIDAPDVKSGSGECTNENEEIKDVDKKSDETSKDLEQNHKESTGHEANGKTEAAGN